MVETIKHYKNIKNTPAIPLIMAQWQESLEIWPDRQDYSFGWQNEALVLFSDNMPIGVICFDIFEHDRSCHINVGYVDPSCRRQGYYNILFDHLVAFLQEKDIMQINSSTLNNNEIMHTVATKQGRVPIATIYRYSLSGDKG